MNTNIILQGQKIRIGNQPKAKAGMIFGSQTVIYQGQTYTVTGIISRRLNSQGVWTQTLSVR